MSLLYYVRTCVLARSFSRVTSVSCSLSISLASYALSLAFIALSRSLRAYRVCVCVGGDATTYYTLVCVFVFMCVCVWRGGAC